MQQHAQPVHDLAAARLRLGQKIGHQWGIDQIRHQRFRAERVERKPQGLFADHPHRGRIDHGAHAFQHVSGLCPVIDDHPRTEFRPDLFRPQPGPVGDAQFRRAVFQKRGDHGPRRAARTDDRRRALIGAPVGRMLHQIGDESVTICIIGMNLTILAEDQGIRRADQGRAIGDEIRDLKHRFLVRDGQIDADEAHFRQAAQHLGQVFGADRKRDVIAGKPVAVQPVPVQKRRTGMRDRPADHPGKGRMADGRCGILRVAGHASG